MENSYKVNGNGPTENGYSIARHTHSFQPSLKGSLPWLDIRVFYVRVSKCELDNSAPEVLTLNHVPLNPDTLLEVNGVRSSIYSDGISTLLKRDRVDRKSEEVTFVSTDSIRMSGSVKFEVFDKDNLLLFGALELCNNNGGVRESNSNGQSWSIHCESNIIPGTKFFKEKQLLLLPDSTLPTIEVYIAGSFSGTPIILTKTLHLSSQKRHTRKGALNAIPEDETNENGKDPSVFALQAPDYMYDKHEDEDYHSLYTRTAYADGEDGELSWFNAGVRVGVGIGLSVCLGIGIGVGILVKSYQGATGQFRRRLF